MCSLVLLKLLPLLRASHSIRHHHACTRPCKKCLNSQLQMLKLYTNTSTLYPKTLKTKLQNHTLYTPISHLHNLNNPAIQFILDQTKGLQDDSTKPQQFSSQKSPCSARISHPWPEWVELMGKLLKCGYFEGIGNPFGSGELGSKECNQIRTACLNFARDRFHLIRYLSHKDIQVVAGSGCPCVDRKVVNSGKRLRAHVGIDEGNVCSSCILRGNCERAYMKAHENEGGRTVDVMRFLVAYGLDPLTGYVENKPCLNKKVKESTRNLLKEMVDLSSKEVDCEPVKAISPTSNLSAQDAEEQINVPTKQGDWICPKCNFLNFARNIKCLRCDGLFQERLSKLRQEQEHLPLKKGDWICEKCNFLNFAKNTRCLQCKEKPPKRQINPGEWECESCNYINFRRNMVCLKCDHRRSKASVPVSDSSQPAKDNVGHRRTRPVFGEEIQSEEGRVNVWKFVGSESEDHDNSNSLNQMPGFFDFPVVGGKSELSRDMHKQEKWKSEMATRCKSAAKARENADEFKSSIMRRNCEYFQCTDDEEMAEWFCGGNEKGENTESCESTMES